MLKTKRTDLYLEKHNNVFMINKIISNVRKANFAKYFTNNYLIFLLNNNILNFKELNLKISINYEYKRKL